MGDSRYKGKYYSMFKNMDIYGELEQVIIKQQHNCLTDAYKYAGKFIPIEHEYLVILKKGSPYIIPISHISFVQKDIRESKNTTWASVMAMILEDHGGHMRRNELAEAMGKTEKAKQNSHIAAKMRQELQRHPRMFRTSKDTVYLTCLVA